MTYDTEYRTDWDTTSFSELSTLASCEEKWYRRYVLREPSESGPAALKGTLWHEGTGALLIGGDMEAALAAMHLALDESGADLEDEKILTAVNDAEWLVARYARHYAVQLKQVKVVAHEIQVSRELHFPSRDGWKSVTIKAYIDTLLDFNGQLWLREAKSSGRRDVLEMSTISPQISTYWWIMEEVEVPGYPDGLYGVLLDYAYTYRWKLQKPTQTMLIEESGIDFPNKKAAQEWARIAVANHPGIEAHSDSESFEQQWLDRTDDQIEQSVLWAQNILARRDTLVQYNPGTDRAPTIRNIGNACLHCDHKTACFADMAFPQDDISLDLS